MKQIYKKYIKTYETDQTRYKHQTGYTVLRKKATCHKNLQNQCLQVPQDQRESWWRQGGCLKEAGYRKKYHESFLIWCKQTWPETPAVQVSTLALLQRLLVVSWDKLSKLIYMVLFKLFKIIRSTTSSRDLLKKLVSRRGGKLPWRYNCLCTVERFLCKACSWENLERRWRELLPNQFSSGWTFSMWTQWSHLRGFQQEM